MLGCQDHKEVTGFVHRVSVQRKLEGKYGNPKCRKQLELEMITSYKNRGFSDKQKTNKQTL